MEKFLTGIGDKEMERFLRVQGYDNISDMQNGAERYRWQYGTTPKRSSTTAPVISPSQPKIVPKARAVQAETKVVGEKTLDNEILEAIKRGQDRMASVLGQQGKQIKDMQQVSWTNPQMMISPPAQVVSPIPTVVTTPLIPVANKTRKPFVKTMQCMNCGEDHACNKCKYNPTYKCNDVQQKWIRAATEAKKTGTRIGPPPINQKIVYGPGIAHKRMGAQEEQTVVNEQVVTQPESARGDASTDSGNDNNDSEPDLNDQ
jgi:hypothetical protein